MKPIVISDQPRLGFWRTAWIAMDGIRYRLFRAMVTVAVIAVAVAFLMNILSESFIKRSVALRTRDRIARGRLVHEWVARLTTPGEIEQALREIAGDDERSRREIARLGGFTPAEMAELRDAARLAVRTMDYLNDLSYTRRRRLVHSATGVDMIEWIATPEGRRAFFETVEKSAVFRLPFSRADLEGFLDAWPRTRARVERLLEGRRAAIAAVAAARGERSVLEALADARGAFGEAIRAAGFELDPEGLAPVVAEQARRELDVRWIEQLLDLRPVRQVVAQYFDTLPADVTVMQLWRFASAEERASRLLEAARAGGETREGMTPARVVGLAAYRRETSALEQAARLTIGIGGGWMGLGERMSWLLLVSMLVCAIGISNAMLMTVTERFREIATLKCLGALDGFIMLMFVLESCMLGVVGGIVGGLLGLLIGGGRMLAAFGRIAAQSLPWMDLGIGLGAALAVGVILAAIAAVYPSFRAARLAPMEAMRVE